MLLAVIAVVAVLLFLNAKPAITESPTQISVAPTTIPTQAIDDSWQQVIQQHVIDTATPRPTATLPPASTANSAVSATSVLKLLTPVAWQLTVTATRALPVTATQAVPTAVASPVGQTIRENPAPSLGQFSPPPEITPLSLDPRDHFWFKRPVDVSANSEQIFWYVYGSDGPQKQWRVHAGIDLPNPVGKEVHAAGPGTVVYAGDHYIWKDESGNVTDIAYTYGNLVVIEHDFGFHGKKLWTLYAHMSVIIAKRGDHVETGDVIGLSGQSGVVSGPHVHFEVRESINNYFDTRNPILWMAPYLDHGVIAGRILFPNGVPIEDAPVLLKKNGRTVDQSSTYVHPHYQPNQARWNVNSDDEWHENFVLGDVPAGDYQVVVLVNNVEFTRTVTVHAGTTSFIDFGEVFQDSPVSNNSK